MLYDVEVFTREHGGGWFTDLTTGSKHRALERREYLYGRVPVRVKNIRGEDVYPR